MPKRSRNAPRGPRLSNGVRLVLSTAPARAAEKLARGLVEGGHAVCVNVVPGAASVYRWKGRIERARESLLVIKARTGRVPALLKALEAAHPYEVPEALVLAPRGGLVSYLGWIASGGS